VDFRYVQEPEYDKCEKPFFVMIDSKTLALVFATFKQKKVPKLSYAHRIVPENFFFSDKQPQSLEEVKEVLTDMRLIDDACVMYCASFKPYKSFQWFNGYNASQIVPFLIEAYTKPDLSIGYRTKSHARPNSHSNQLPEYVIPPESNPCPDPKTKNRRSSVSVRLTALNLVSALGICTNEEQNGIAVALSSCVGAMWITYDDSKQARHAVYADKFLRNGFMIELKNSAFPAAEPHNSLQWTRMFSAIEKTAKRMREAKQIILQPIIARLNRYVVHGTESKWSQCVKQLKACIQKLKIFVFSTDDLTLHTLKVPLAGCMKVHGSRGVYIHTLANNSVTSLTCKDYTFLNIFDLFSCRPEEYDHKNDDRVLWELANEWLDDIRSKARLQRYVVPIVHAKLAHLRTHQKIGSFEMRTFLTRRGIRNVEIMHELYEALADFTLKEFRYDITTLQRTSIPKQAFDIVWLNYVKLAGPMAHSVEKTHPHTEFKLRPWCTGGFSYSCQDKLKADRPLYRGNNVDLAHSLHEYDIVSSYGNSGKTMATCKGFGFTFPETQKRHKSLEYMAVMYTIYNWVYVQGKKIVNVFSNFSPLGVFSIGKFPIDLVAIFEDGSVHLCQIDGHFVHGDYNHPECPSLTRYANNATRQDLEHKTQLRDQTILRWMCDTNNPFISYSVLTDCCHPEYTRKHLLSAFKTIPELQKLVSGIAALDGSLDCIDPNEMTFLAIVTGNCARRPSVFGPVFTQDLKAPTTFSGTMLLTSDYYQYLKKNFDFQCASVEWIVYYKKCTTLPAVFEWLCNLRNDHQRVSKSRAAIVKSIINLSCGFFGFNRTKSTRVVSRVTHSIPKRFNIYRHAITDLKTEFGEVPYYLVQTYYPPPKQCFMCPTPLVLFVSIVEFGKMRLNQALQCLFKHMRPQAIRLMYSNVDNFVLACSADALTGCLKERTQLGEWRFFVEWGELYPSFVNPDAGMLKLEWYMPKAYNWKFVSPFRMQYSVVCNQPGQNKQKVSSLQGLGTETTYKMGVDALKKKPVKVQQVRRVNKIAGPETHPVHYVFSHK